MFITALFDKSFLQSLSADEALWFDQFFAANVCPIFYLETLADLAKETTTRSTQDEVRILADKFPELHGAPCVYHRNLLLAELNGAWNLKRERIPRTKGVPVSTATEHGIMYRDSPEVQAFVRWQNKNFLDEEHSYAKLWRQDLACLDAHEVFSQASRNLNIPKCGSPEEALMCVQRAMLEYKDRYKQIGTYFEVLDIDPPFREQIIERWKLSSYRNLVAHVPYASRVLEVQLFFAVAAISGLISTQKPSNLVDFAYLYYLPLCNFFVSSDKLHRKYVPMFLDAKQKFVWGPDLKTSLSEINEHFLTFPEEIKDTGVVAFAQHPPKEFDGEVSRLWDTFIPNWRSSPTIDPKKLDELPARLVDKFRGYTKAQESLDHRRLLKEPDFAIGKREGVRQKRGAWYQLPKNL